jgi:hypothetical protein
MSMESQTTTSNSDAYSDIDGQATVDYSKNPYWAPQDLDYINSSTGGGN